MNKVITFLKLFYYILPRVIREQYQDSLSFYKLVLIRNFDKLRKKTLGLSVTLVNNINKLNSSIEILHEEKNRVSEISKPKLYIDGKHYYREKLEGKVPNINVYLLSNIDIIGWTDALIYKSKMYHNELNEMQIIHDLKRWDIFTKISDKKDEYRLTVTNEEKNDDDTVYITLLKEHSVNYYHFITEGLPRLITIISVLKNAANIDIKDCTVLIDEEMPPQSIEVIKNLLPKSTKIKEVEKGCQVKCSKLIYCTPLWISLDNTTSLPNPKKEFFVDKYALKIVREAIMALVDNKNKKPLKNKKIYLQRSNTKLRAITNILEVEKLLYKYDFEFVDAGSLSFDEQINLFSQADIIIGASGASFTNILFMKEDSTAISLYPSAQSTNYYVFQPLADIANINFIHFLTNPAENSDSVHANASVNIDELNKLLIKYRFSASVKSVKEINQLDCPIEILHEEKNRVSEISKPKLYIDGKHYYREKLEGKVPNINVYLLSNIDIIGWTDALIYKSKMYHNELNEMQIIHDLKRWDIFTKISDKKDEYRLTVTNEEKNDDDTVYITLLKEHSVNYYHFITEGLPRLITIISVLKNAANIDIKDCTVLIDEEMPPQSIEVIKNLLPKSTKIKEVEKGCQVKCSKLIYCTPLWISLDNTTSLPNPKKEFFVDKYALKIVREAIMALVDNKNKKPLKNKKIYLQRSNTKLRAITNILEVEKLLYKYDFEFVDAGSLSFDEQINLFSQADIIIGASGASFTNILFMKEDSTAISLYPSAQSTNYYVFQPLADIANINFIHFLTNPAENSDSVHANASVNIDELNKLLKDIT